MFLCYRKISEDDARSSFQLARNNAKHFAIVFVAWAQFELLTGLNPTTYVISNLSFSVSRIYEEHTVHHGKPPFPLKTQETPKGVRNTHT